MIHNEPSRARRAADGIWRLADPKISLASMASMFLGACAAMTAGPVSPAWLAFTVAGIFCIEVAKNASGEIFDFDSGTDLGIATEDRSPFSGGKRVLVDGLLTRRQTAVIAAVAYALGIAAGLVIAAAREPRILWLGLSGVGCAFFYHAPPLKLSYRGLGEAAVAVCYGPLICCGTFLVQRGTVPSWVVLLSLPLGLLIGAFLWINEFPDYRSDLASSKRTLVVQLGRPSASVVFAVIVAAAFAALAASPLGGVPRGAWLGAIAVAPAISAARTAISNCENTARLIPAQANTLRAFVLLSVGSGMGLLLFR